MGRVLNLKGEPVRNAKVEIWQANAHGRYTHPGDTNPAPLDPNFEGSAILTADYDGQYRFKTIKPAAYPVSPNMIRPAHIHFRIRVPGYETVVTQLFVAGDRYLDSDAVFGVKSTLVKVLSGVIRPDSGLIAVNGSEVRVQSPAQAGRVGLAPVFQDPALVPDLTVAQNLRLTRAPVDEVRERFREMDLELDFSALVAGLVFGASWAAGGSLATSAD